MLKLLAGQHAALPAVAPEETAPRIQRKVIIRHVSHSRAAEGLIPSPHLGRTAPLPAAWNELPPESATELPGAPANEPLIKPTLPNIAWPADDSPHNELHDIAPSVVHGHWQGAATGVEPIVVRSEPDNWRLATPAALVNVHLDALPEPLVEDGTQPSLPSAFAAKSLDDDRESAVRFDPPHVKSSHRPHVRFGQPTTTKAQLDPEEIESLAADLPTIHEPASSAQTIDIVETALDASIEEPAEIPAETPAAEITPAAPVWEVDRFQWPRVCERLLADDDGYLAQAGEKLLAAVRDGLKTLAITGSRRGEGRTTLALCLARVAARANIHVAVLDADFARPQIASRLGLEITHGWQDAAAGHIPLSEAAIKSLEDNVTVLPLELTAIRRSLSLADARVTATLRAAASTFDLVIVDLGPLTPGEQLTFPPGESCPLDAVIVVRDLRFATATESQDVGERIYEAGVEAVGIAENFVEDSSAVPSPSGRG